MESVSRWGWVLGPIALTFISLLPARVFAEDWIVMSNGDRLTGEVKQLDRGLLQFDTDATDTIAIKWDRIAALSSEQNFEITLDDGRRILASVSPGSDGSKLQLDDGRETLELATSAVVRMEPIEGRTIDRIDMDVDLGYSLAKANKVSQDTFGYDFDYRSETRSLGLNFDLARSSTSSQPSSTRANLSMRYTRLLFERNWNPVGLAQIERNDELGLNRRYTFGGGMTRAFVDTNSRRISFVGGVVYTAEKELDAELSNDVAEAAIGVDLDWFRYNDPEFDVKMRAVVYESISSQQRTRGNVDVSLRWELFGDFTWGLSTYYSFNTRRNNPESSSSDYGVVTSIGWSF